MGHSTYTGVGSRKTPPEILSLMRQIAGRLASLGFILRSGGAAGADSAFESGAAGKCEIYLASDATEAAARIASSFHPAWHRCSEFARNLHARNAFQVLGRNLKSPSKFVVCWTRDGAIDHGERSIETGGTGTAISIASENGIPVFNLARSDHRHRLERFLKS